MGATTIMIIRHAEKSGTYDGIDYRGVNPSGAEDKESLVTLGWERAGALATLFSPPWGRGGTRLSVPGSVFAADPADKSKPDAKGHKADDEPSQRPYQTVSAVAAKLGLRIDTRFAKDKFKAIPGPSHPQTHGHAWKLVPYRTLGRAIATTSCGFSAGRPGWVR